MEELELVCFQIISFAGEARSAYMGAIQTAKQGNYEEAEKLIKEGGDAFLLAVELMDAYRRISILEAKEA